LAGRTLNALAPGPIWRWDRANRLDVTFSSDPPASITEREALAGGNRFALQGQDGVWEVFSAAGAELIGPQTVRLSGLLRGLDGTEVAADRAVAAGAQIILLDETLVPVASDLALIGRDVRYRVGPFDRDAADPTVAEIGTMVQASALLPRMPVHARARREAGGVRIGWIRQTRSGGDAWEPVEVPLSEDRESWRVAILSGGTTLRIIESGAPSLLYAASDELADFGAPRATLSLRISQLSPVAGEGRTLIRTIPVW
jgi:hypothetical protein